MSGSSKELQLNDFVNNRIYTITVSNDDYNRAIVDSQFANSLLIHARSTTDEETAECEDQPSTSRQISSPDPCSDQEYSMPNDVQLHSATQNTRSTNFWSYDQTIYLINSMATYYSDFNDPRKRKHIFEHVTNDLISAGFTVDSRLVQNKWKGLLRSYTKAKDTKNRTGQGPSRFLFYEIIDDIVGNQPKNSCSHSLNSLDTSISGPDLESLGNNEYQAETVEGHPEVSDEPQLNKTSAPREEELPTAEEITITPGKENNSNRKRKRLSEKQLKKDYIDLKREEYMMRQKRHEDKMSLEKERNEIDLRKLSVLEEYLKKKQHY